MILNQTVAGTERSDAELVTESRGGNRGSFRQIVERYQTLVCSIAYSATGNLSRSEDVAQETFIAAWTRLDSLREPEKLRGWLCGIVRNHLHRDRREEGREPVRRAVAMDHASETPAPEATPSDQAVTREEEAILWRSLENIPLLYREPLVLFYREHHSVEQVAAALELSEDAVKQRLSRGRKLLQEGVQTLVENTLRRTVPGSAFSAAVLTLLPAAGPVAATAGAGFSAKGAATAKSGLVFVGLVALAPFLGIAAGVGAHWLIIRDGTADPVLRRKRIAKVIVAWVVYLGLVIGGEQAVHEAARHFGWSASNHFVAVVLFWFLLIVGTLTVQTALIRWLRARQSERVVAESGPATVARPLRPFTLAAVVAGAHLAMFSWLITLAWRYSDTTGVALTTGIMLVLGIAAYVRGRGKTGAMLGQLAGGHIAFMGTAILLILNLRVATWVAASSGISVAEARRAFPLWTVPVLTLALMGWSVGLFNFIRPDRRISKRKTSGERNV